MTASAGSPAANGRAREIWVDARSARAPDDPLVSAAVQAGVPVLLVRPEQRELFRPLGLGLELAVEVASADGLAALDPRDLAASRSREALRAAEGRGLRAVLLETVADEASLRRAIADGRGRHAVVVALADETNIPLELIVAELQGSGTRVLKEVGTAEQALVAFGVVERGADGALLRTDRVAEVTRLASGLADLEAEPLPLVAAEVKRTFRVGMGHRACVDLVTLFGRDEGLIVGSTSQGGFLVASETHPLPYMNTRPFRVNAGAVHSYVWTPRGRTGYLSELAAGGRVLAARVDGRGRPAVVGRVKIELRPLLLVEAVAAGATINAFLQDDWHVRVLGPGGEVVSVTTLRPGGKILAHVSEPGRHVGIPVKEEIVER